MSKKNANQPAGQKASKRGTKHTETPAVKNETAPSAEIGTEEKTSLPPAESVSSTQTPDNPASNPPAMTPATSSRSMSMKNLNLTLSKAPRKDKRLVIYNIEGRTGSVQFLSTLFGGDQDSQGTPPEKLTLNGEFAEPKAKVAKVNETPEERKARLKALPKLTLAEKVAKAEQRTSKLKAKLEADAAKAAAKQAAAAGTPAGAPAETPATPVTV